MGQPDRRVARPISRFLVCHTRQGVAGGPADLPVFVCHTRQGVAGGPANLPVFVSLSRQRVPHCLRKKLAIDS
jgi:hypothetical protein